MFLKITRGGQSKPEKVPTKFAKIDNTREIGDRIMEKLFADRDKYIDRMRAQGKL